MVFGFMKKKEEKTEKTEGISTVQTDRYANQRHIIGEEGQEKLKKAGVVIVGCGAIGVSAAHYLAAAGVGRIKLIDNDYVNITDIQKQPLYTMSDIGKRKAFVIADRLKNINPEIIAMPNTMRIRRDTVSKFLNEDIIIDASNDLPTHYLLSDACVLSGKKTVFASASAFEGQVTVFDSKNGPCYRCIFPSPTLQTKEGILGMVIGVVGLIQATEAVKLILGSGNTLTGRMLSFSLNDMRFLETDIEKDENCAVCGKNPTVKELIDYDEFCGTKKHIEPAAVIFEKGTTPS